MGERSPTVSFFNDGMFISAPKFKIRGNRLPLPLILLTTPINELINYLKEQKQIDSFIIKNK